MLAHRKGTAVRKVLIEGDNDGALALGPLEDFTVVLACKPDNGGVMDCPGTPDFLKPRRDRSRNVLVQQYREPINHAR
jgi:hypothetical protein